MKCKVCSREAQAQPQSKYCEHHQKAFENLQSKFEVWRKASNIEWEAYLKEVAKNPLTGTWVKEVAENLLAQKEKESTERNV